MTAWLTIIGAVISVAAIGLKVWYANSPERKARKQREANIDVHNKIATRDVGALRKLLQRLRAGKS